MQGKLLVEDLRKRIADEMGMKRLTDSALAGELGLTPAQLRKMKSCDVKPEQVWALMEAATERRNATFGSNAIRPIVEYCELWQADSAKTVRYMPLSDYHEDEHYPYYADLIERLRAANGVYVFYDSRGRAIYVGKAAKQCLWDEMNEAYNRLRDVQRIKIVDHPADAGHPPLGDKKLPIKDRKVKLYFISTYMSAYEVIPALIDNVEALLIRSFANDLLNVKVENFK